MGTTDRRHGIELLEPDESWVLLGSAPVGRLAVAIANHPDLFPVNHVVDHRTEPPCIVFRTAEGTKLAAAVLGTGVAFEADGYDPVGGDAWSVVVKGRAVEIDTLDDLLAAEDLPLFPWNAAPKHRFVRIVADEITGRRFHVVPGAPGTA